MPFRWESFENVEEMNRVKDKIELSFLTYDKTSE